jgi:hypothetical protein
LELDLQSRGLSHFAFLFNRPGLKLRAAATSLARASTGATACRVSRASVAALGMMPVLTFAIMVEVTRRQLKPSVSITKIS